MALLLAMYQKMKLVREKNQLVLADARTASKKSRIQKHIEQVQKMYTSKIAQIDSQVKMQSSIFKYQMTQAQQQMGLNMMGGNSIFGSGFGNSYQYGSSNLSMFVINALNQLVAGGTGNQELEDKFKDQSVITDFIEGLKNGTIKQNSDGTIKIGDTDYTEDESNLMRAAYNAAQNAQYNQQMQMQQMAQMSEAQLTAWSEMAKAELEAEQDAALEPLNYEDTMLDLEKTQIETRLEEVRAELDSYKQLCSEEAKDSAPTFGLG